MYYVLIETDENTGTENILGVFDSSEIDNEILTSYYGICEVISSHLVEDSGVEWVKRITAGDGVCTLTMLSFILNEM